MSSIYQTTDSIIIENDYAEIRISTADASVERVINKKTGENICGEKTSFFSLTAPDRQTCIIPVSLMLTDNIIRVITEIGEFSVAVAPFDSYFQFELVSPLPEGCYSVLLAHGKYVYDETDKSSVGACGIPVTYWVNPHFYPDSKDRETMGEVVRHLRDTGAKYALIIAPICEQCEIIKTVSRTIDPSTGLYSEIGGAWGRDARINFGNYTIQYASAAKFITDNVDFWKSINVDQVDFHQCENTFRQGDFKFELYDSAEDFKKNVSDVLATRGLSAGLHTYSFYIRYDCDAILAEPKWQRDLGVLETFTLESDISAEADFIPALESTAEITNDYNFFSRTTPYILIGEELIRFDHAPNGFIAAERGASGTKAVSHKKGETIKHIDGFYGGIAPKLSSELFLEIARMTADTFNRGGFCQIYLDALDGISRHCEDREDVWFYAAQFVCELLQYTDKYPLLETSYSHPSLWLSRGRVGAADTSYRAYKSFNNRHCANNLLFVERYSAPTLGWYNFYPTTERFPGNEHTKYHHTDAIDHMGSLAVMHDFSNVFNGLTPERMDRYAGLRRNVELYGKYEKLRKSQYFNDDYLQKLRDGKYEYQMVETEGRFAFAEKEYATVKLNDLQDNERNCGTFTNSFEKQTPFIRIEALMGGRKTEETELLPLDENKELNEQVLCRRFDDELDLSEKLAKIVRVRGNGKKGSAVCIKLRCASKSELGYGIYIIDTDFEGWREFVLLEADNGERPELPFDEGRFGIYRSGLNNDRITQVSVETAGDTEGVRMTSVTACPHVYEVLKNPTVTVGETSVMFECELMSSDFIEFDGKEAKVIDRYGNEKKIWFASDLQVPAGEFEAKLTARALNHTIPRAQLTFGFTGATI